MDPITGQCYELATDLAHLRTNIGSVFSKALISFWTVTNSQIYMATPTVPYTQNKCLTKNDGYGYFYNAGSSNADLCDKCLDDCLICQSDDPSLESSCRVHASKN